ncbi:nucleotidyltransferase family protein [Thermoplasmatales archaeon AK]|nr:nucleotidyltransferase family protein [Thermoplasmatales archaeon AK]
MISIILAAGSGTRMRPLSYYIPKILLPVKGRPVLNYVLDNLGNLRVDAHYIVVSDHFDTVERYLKSTGMDNVKVVRGLGWETGGDLSIALEQINVTDDTAVMNGDIITDVEMSELYNHHKKSGKLASIAVFSLNDPLEAKRFGRIELSENSTITKFEEKSQDIDRIPALVNTGFYIFDRRLIEQRGKYLVPRKFKLENELFPRLAKEGQLSGYAMNIGYWWDVGTIDSYLRAENYMINNKGVVPP